jgi:hypothetical protein
MRFSYLWTYGLYSPVHNAFDAAKSITWASVRELGPGNGVEPLGECHLAPKQMAFALRLHAILQCPKMSRFPGPNPLTLALVMGLAESKSIKQRRINHRSEGSFIHISSHGYGTVCTVQ